MKRCDHCNSVFANRQNLIKHQKNAKYCLTIQNKKQQDPSINCEYCGKNYLNRLKLAQHYGSCIEFHAYIKAKDVRLEEKDSRIKALEAKCDELENRLERLAKQAIDKPTRIGGRDNNNNGILIQNLLPISETHLRECARQLTIEHIKAGMRGYARYASGDPLKDRVICTDKARKKLRYKDEEEKIVEDLDGIALAKKFFTAIDERNQELINEASFEINEKVQEIIQAGKAHQEDIVGLLSTATKLQGLGLKCQKIAKGDEEDLRNEFIAQLVKLL